MDDLFLPASLPQTKRPSPNYLQFRTKIYKNKNKLRWELQSTNERKNCATIERKTFSTNERKNFDTIEKKKMCYNWKETETTRTYAGTTDLSDWTIKWNHTNHWFIEFSHSQTRNRIKCRCVENILSLVGKYYLWTFFFRHSSVRMSPGQELITAGVKESYVYVKMSTLYVQPSFMINHEEAMCMYTTINHVDCITW